MTETTTSVLPEQAEEPTARRPHTGWRSRAMQRWASRALAATAALAAGFAGCSPTGTAAVDVALTAAFAAVVTLAAARARRWPLFVPVIAAVALARDEVAILAIAASVTALLGATRRRRDRIWGAATGALAIQALLRLPDIGFHGATALITAAAVAPVLIAGYRMCRSHERRIIRRVVFGLTALVTVIGAVYGAALFSIATDLEDAVSRSQSGLQATRDGETAEARGHFTVALDGFAAASDRLDAWWARPILAVPVAGQHARALSQAADDGRTLTAAARDTVETADYDRLRYEDGRLDLDRIAATAAPLDRTRNALDGALRGADDTDSPWLLSPLSDRLHRFEAELTDAQQEADVAAQAIAVAPDLLGGNGPRRYFIAFVTPAELRGSGGFMGSWAEITADDGELRLTESGPVRELMPELAAPPLSVTGPPDYLARYGRFTTGRYVGDFAFSPHFPDDAEVMSELYPQATGAQLDGVISVDPVALAALLTFTGPLEVEGFDRPLTAENAAEFLLRDNYALFPDSEQQNDALARLVETTFDELTTGDLPGPRELANVLSPSTREGRIRMWSPRAAEQALFARLGATGAFPVSRPGHDFFAVSSQNTGNNKIDVFQSRAIDYSMDVAADGALEATARITIRNDAPTDGSVPEYVVGNTRGDPLGTNRMLFSVHTPHMLEGATLDGVPVGMEAQSEAGYAVYSRFLAVPAGGEVTLELRLRGSLETGAGAVLDLAPHPTVTADQLTVHYREAGHDQVDLPAELTDGRRRVTLSARNS